MSLSLIPYQPLPFGIEENCTLPCANWVQKIERTDETSIQFGFGACPTAGTVIVNGDFASGGDNWTQTGTWTFNNGIASSPVSGTSGNISQVVTMSGVDYVEVSFNLTLNNGVFFLTADGSYVQQVNFGGTKSFVVPVSGASASFFFVFSDALGGSISNIIIKPINTRVRLDVTDTLDVSEATIPDTWYTFNNGFLTANFEDWSSLALDDGCYKLGIYDPCECSQFGFIGDNFDVPNQFRVITGAATIDGGAMTFDFVGQTQVRSRALLCPNVDYEITYTVSGISGATQDFQIRIGTTNGVVRTTDGTYTETLSTSFTGDIEVRFIANDSGSVSTFEIIDFSIEAVTPIISHRSVEFNLKDTHKCSVLIDACGVGEEFNFGFDGTGFNPKIRLEGTYRTSNYPTTRTSYEYSNGQKNVPYMRTRRAKTFLFGAPEYVHDFSALWLGFSNLNIDGVAKFCEDDEPPTISPEDDVDFGLVTFTFSDKVELTEKRSCTTLANTGCTSEGVALTIPSSGGFNLQNPQLADQGRILLFP